MADQRVIENLQSLGMSGYEAKAYTALVAAGQPLNGYEVAKASGVPRSTVYETLAKLVGRGAAYEVRTGDESIEYMPLPPASLVSRLRRDFDSCLESLEDSLARVAVIPEAHLIHNLSRHEDIMARAADVVSGARRELFLSGWPEDLCLIKPLVRKADRAGIDVSVMCFGEDDDPVGRTYSHRFSTPDVVHRNLGCRLLVVAADRQAVLIGGFLEDDAWGVYADDPAVVLVAVEYVRHDIAIQVLAERVGPEKVRDFWLSDPELIRLRSDEGVPALALRVGGPAALAAKKPPRRAARA